MSVGPLFRCERTTSFSMDESKHKDFRVFAKNSCQTNVPRSSQHALAVAAVGCPNGRMCAAQNSEWILGAPSLLSNSNPWLLSVLPHVIPGVPSRPPGAPPSGDPPPPAGRSSIHLEAAYPSNRIWALHLRGLFSWGLPSSNSGHLFLPW
jgi:hypothetical protein